MLRIADRVKETTATTGTGAISLGGASTGFQPFSAVLSDQDTCYYALQQVDGYGAPTGVWETGVGTYNAAPNTLARTQVLSGSSGSGNAVTLTGATQVWLDAPAPLFKDAAGMFMANRPKSAQFTALRNTGIGSGGTLADLPSGRGFSMVAPSASSSDNLLLASQAAPSSGAWTITALLNVSMIANSNAYSAAGLFVGDSSGEFVDFAIWAAGSPSNLTLTYQYWNSLNSFNNSHNQQSRAYATMLLWMRVVYNGTTFAFSTSVDGETWSNAASVSATAFIGAPATCGLFVNSNAGAVSTTADTAVSCYHYSQG